MNGSNISKPHVHIAINRDGALFVFFLTALGLASVYSGKNGLILLFCCLLAALIILFAIARRNFQSIQIERKFVENIFAKRDARIDLMMTNIGRNTVWGLHVFERFGSEREIGPMFVRKLSPGQTVTARYMCQFPERGIAQFSSFEIRSRFPVPFIEFRQVIQGMDSAYVFPAPDPRCDQLYFDNDMADKKQPRAHTQDYAIRELVHGRRTGRILWKLSARRRQWLEYVPIKTPIQSHTAMIHIKSRKDMPNHALFERQLSQAATYTMRRMANGQTGYVKIGNQIYPYGHCPKQHRQLLEALAVYQVRLGADGHH